VVERLDEERLETLRAWGAGLSASARDELRAAGKAILMLVDEIDRLEADLWNARAAAKDAVAAAAQAAVSAPQPARDPEPAVADPRLPGDEDPGTGEPARGRPQPAAKPSQVLALTLSERIARGRAPSEPAT
jgi:hypothetical protein